MCVNICVDARKRNRENKTLKKKIKNCFKQRKEIMKNSIEKYRNKKLFFLFK